MSDLEDMIEILRRLADAPERAAAVAAPLVDEAIKSTVRAGTTPTGQAWQPKKGGGAPLVHAADHIKTAAYGPLIRIRLEGVDKYHHYGAGVPRRPVLPDPGTIPPAIARALDRAGELVFAEVTS